MSLTVPSYVYVALVLFTDATGTGGCPSHLVIACLASSVLLFGRYERCPLSNVPVRDLLLHGRFLDVSPGCKAWTVLLSERCSKAIQGSMPWLQQMHCMSRACSLPSES
ncbi:uncharacterized protein F5147DRAFT_683209 [Suillus discolor]|uniref:Secreted protein n=1 Tax=Suillus discolor TaxID=1912936 RepID=A0A9P7JWV9_9AGAM|nr:uncharacterized protein F5147DRAFT_683209 [Suillus discolor]KAG2113209.1 hypothetical protein F5147DRAFT_683209 [Suillus discolor]